MSTPNSTQVYAVLYFSNGNQGWQERYWLNATSYAAALVVLQAIVDKRKATLPSTAFIVWSRVSFAGTLREADTLTAVYPIAGTADAASSGYTPTGVATCNDPEAAIHLRFQTSAGQWSNYYLRCIPDDKMTGRALSVTVDPAAVVGTPPATWQDRVVDLIQYLKANTQHAAFASKGVPPNHDTYNVDDWSKVIVRGISNRKTGRPFGAPHGRQPAGA
jgi:hypothetical protein